MISPLPWRLWASQILAILRLELRKNLARKRAIPVYLLAAAPLFLFAAHAIGYAIRMACRIGHGIGVALAGRVGGRVGLGVRGGRG